MNKIETRNSYSEILLKETSRLPKCSECCENSCKECENCKLQFCVQHIWVEYCGKCLKQNYKSELNQEIIPRTTEISKELEKLHEEKQDFKRKIKATTTKILKIQSLLKSKSTENISKLKQKIEQEKKNHKNLLVTAENLKKAVNDLRKTENSVTTKFTLRSDSIDTYFSQENSLKFEEQSLLAELDSLKRTARSSVPYIILRGLACNTCISKVKKLFRPDFLNSLTKNKELFISSLTSSHLSIKSAPDAHESCKCSVI